MKIPDNIKGFLAKMTAKVIEAMETEGRLPWDNGMWSKGLPVSHSTGKCYRGVNLFLLSLLAQGSNEWITFNGAKAEGGHIRKGSKGTPVVIFWWEPVAKNKDTVAAEEDETPIRLRPRWKFYTVFEVGISTEGIEPKYNRCLKEEPPRIEEAEAFTHKFFETSQLGFEERMGTPAYSPARHVVKIPPRANFKTAAAYYGTLFHEMAHSTGKALKRAMTGSFGDEAYSLEELVAEFSASLLLHHFHIQGEVEEAKNSTAYLAGWMKSFRNNPEWLFEGGRLAEKAVSFMLEKGGIAEQKNETAEEEKEETGTAA